MTKPYVKAGKGLYFSSPVALALMRETGAADPVAAIEAKANELLVDADVGQPPVNLDILKSFVDVRSIEDVDIPEAGRLVPRLDGGFVIQVRAGENKGRRNFTICHEIGHALMPGASTLNKPKIDVHTGWYKQNENEEEFLCDRAARTLLLPESMFRQCCEQKTPSLQSLCDLAGTFEASLEAVAFRLAGLHLWPCVSVFWELRLKKNQGEAQGLSLPGFEDMGVPVKEYRVKFNVREGKRIIFPADKHVPRDNPMVSNCLSYGSFTGTCTLPTSSGNIAAYVEAMNVPYRHDGELQDRILSLVFFDPSKPQTQTDHLFEYE